LRKSLIHLYQKTRNLLRTIYENIYFAVSGVSSLVFGASILNNSIKTSSHIFSSASSSLFSFFNLIFCKAAHISIVILASSSIVETVASFLNRARVYFSWFSTHLHSPTFHINSSIFLLIVLTFSDFSSSSIIFGQQISIMIILKNKSYFLSLHFLAIAILPQSPFLVTTLASSLPLARNGTKGFFHLTSFLTIFLAITI